MEIAPIDAPSKADRASSAGPSSRPRNYMDDFDSSLTRKRPRLDSGDRSYRSMSADELSATPSRSEPPDPPTVSAEDNQVSFMVSAPSQAPCQVTINVRDSGPSISQLASSEDYQPTNLPPQPNQQSNSKLAGASVAADTSSPDLISVSSSPLRSPEIEVAEIEDIGDQPGETRWRTLGDATDIQLSILEGFPYRAPERTLRENVQIIANAIEYSELGKRLR